MFPTDQKKTRTWGERMFSGIGSSYMTGELILVLLYLIL